MNNDITNVAFETINLNDKLPSAFASEFNKALLDPPHSGAEELITKLSNSKIEQFVYVSCSVASFVRDAVLLVKHGSFELHSVGIADMFPQTKHVEIAKFVRKTNHPIS